MKIRGRDYPEHVRPLIFFGIVLIIFSAVVLAYGFPEVESEGECYQEISSCHGIPGETCLGIQTVSLEPKQSCEYEEEIRTLCRDVRETSCQNNTVSEPKVRGRECSFWRETFEMESRKCSEITR